MRSAVLAVGVLAGLLIAPESAGAQANAPAVNATPIGPPPALPYPAISTTAKNAVLSRLPGILALLGRGEPNTIRATVIVYLRLR